jgi:hypothetical protein
MMSEYMTGRIYKIVHDQYDAIYVGSTFYTLRTRFRWHKRPNNSCTIAKLMNEYGTEHFKILLVKEYQVCDDNHLRAWEQLWMNKLSNFNGHAAFQPLSKQRNKQYDKQYRKEHREQKIEKNKQYYETHRKEVLEQQKQYYEQTHEQKREYQKQYYEKNQEKLKQKMECKCGSVFRITDKARHKRTKKHKKWLASQPSTQ